MAIFLKLQEYGYAFSKAERKEIISRAIKALRIENGLTQKEVAELIKTSYQNYQAYESGKNEPPAEMLVRLALLYDESLDTIMQRDRTQKHTDEENEILTFYAKQIQDLRRRLDNADEETQILLKGMITQAEKTLEATRKALNSRFDNPETDEQ